MGSGVPEEFGGAGLDKISTTVASPRKLSILRAAFAVTHGRHMRESARCRSSTSATEAQKKKYLPKAGDGRMGLAPTAFSEPQAGVPTRRIR